MVGGEEDKGSREELEGVVVVSYDGVVFVAFARGPGASVLRWVL